VSISRFVRESRTKFSIENSTNQKRKVSISHIVKKIDDDNKLSKFVADRAPLYYRDFNKIVDSLQEGYMLSTWVDTLKRLPNSEHFQKSHFGEITSSIFVEDIIGLRRIYSKLSLNTAENQNAYKMDLVCYVPDSNPVNFIFCEVKSSAKDISDGLPAGHDKSCYADIFSSLRDYTNSDEKFDLTTIKDNIQLFSEEEKAKIKNSLKPYQNKIIGYIGIAIIDGSTYDSSEIPVLATRKSNKNFEVELLCVENYKEVSGEVYKILDYYKRGPF
jgi:hypothetical protein